MSRKDFGALVSANRQKALKITNQQFDMANREGSNGEIPSISEVQKLTDNSNANGVDSVCFIDTSLIDSNPFNARVFYSDSQLESLAESIKKDGLKIPIIVMKSDNDRYTIIDGEYRYRAHRHIGADKIKAEVIDSIGGLDLYYLSNLLNEQRSQQSIFDNARSWQRLLDQNLLNSQQEVADVVGKSVPSVSKVLKLNTLPDSVISILVNSEARNNLSSAFELTCIEANESELIELANKIANGEMTRSDIAMFKNATKGKQVKPKVKPKVFTLNNRRIGSIKVDEKGLSLVVNAKNKELLDDINQEVVKTVNTVLDRHS